MIKNYTTLIATAVFCTSLMSACSDETFEGDPVKARTAAEIAIIDDEASFSTYYMPSVGRVGDPMPFYDEKAGDFKVFYLQEFDNNRSHRFHPFWGVSTKDGANYISLGEVLPFGDNDYAQDAALGTGCCYYNKTDNLYYIYYTGHNGNCTNREVVMRATSSDCKTWTKDHLWALNGPDYGFSGNDFRDPQIFEEGGKYHMIIASKPQFGGDPKFADFVSDNMRDWTLDSKINMVWDRMLECPDVFEMGGKWYLVYSEAVQEAWSRKVKYMMADSWEQLKKCFNEGPKWPVGNEFLGGIDGRAFYAAKTASNGTERYIWGWTPFRSGADAYEKNVNVGVPGEPNWSGALVCHKLVQRPDGTLALAAVPAMASKYNKACTVSKVKDVADGVLYNRLGKHNHISFTVTLNGAEDDRFGVSFVRGTEFVTNEEGQRVEQDAPKYYTLKFNNPHWDGDKHDLRRIEFYEEGGAGFIDGADGVFAPRANDNVYNVDIYTDNSVIVMYVNGNVGYTGRIYGLAGNCWSINTYGNDKVSVSNVKVSQY